MLFLQQILFLPFANGGNGYIIINGKLLRYELSSGLIWEYEYDERGNQVHRWNNAGESFYCKYDSHNHCIQESQVINESFALVLSCEYDRLGRMILMTDGNGNRTQFEYWENSGRVAMMTTPEGDVFHYTYDEIDRCMSIRSELGTVRYGYTALGARALETDALGNTTLYRYNLAGWWKSASLLERTRMGKSSTA